MRLAEPVEGRPQGVLLDRLRRRRRPSRRSAWLRTGGAGRFFSTPPHRALLQHDPADAAPAVIGVHPLDDDGREMLHLEGEGALDPHHQGRRLGPRLRVGMRGLALPLDLQRLGEGGEPLADDLGPGHDHVGRGKALRRQARAQADVEKLGEGAGQRPRLRIVMLNVQKPRWNMRCRIAIPRHMLTPAPSATKPDAAGSSRLVRPPPARPAVARQAGRDRRSLTGSGCPRSCCSRRRSTAVKPFYLRFLDRFPTVEALAEAPVEAVMQAWAGLGYYSRARNLHACAKAVVDKHRRALSRHGGRAADAARHRRLYGGGGRGHRLRRDGGGGGRQCGAGHVPPLHGRGAAAEGQAPDPRPDARSWCPRTGPAISRRR